MRVRCRLCCGAHDSGTPFESLFVFGFLSTFVRFVVACEESCLHQLVRVWSLWKQTEKDADGEFVLSGVSEIDIFISSMVSSGSAFWTTTRGFLCRQVPCRMFQESAIEDVVSERRSSRLDPAQCRPHGSSGFSGLLPQTAIRL